MSPGDFFLLGVLGTVDRLVVTLNARPVVTTKARPGTAVCTYAKAHDPKQEEKRYGSFLMSVDNDVMSSFAQLVRTHNYKKTIKTVPGQQAEKSQRTDEYVYKLKYKYSE